MICGWDGCTRIATGLYSIADNFGREYEKEACEECAKYWMKYRPKCILLRRLGKDD